MRKRERDIKTPNTRNINDLSQTEFLPNCTHSDALRLILGIFTKCSKNWSHIWFLKYALIIDFINTLSNEQIILIENVVNSSEN